MNDRSTSMPGGATALRLPPPPRPANPAPRRRPRRRHPAARSRLVTGAISALAFLGLGGAMAANAVPSGTTSQERAGGADAATGETTVSSQDLLTGAQPAAPVFGQTPTSTSGGS